MAGNRETGSARLELEAKASQEQCYQTQPSTPGNDERDDRSANGSSTAQYMCLVKSRINAQTVSITRQLCGARSLAYRFRPNSRNIRVGQMADSINGLHFKLAEVCQQVQQGLWLSRTRRIFPSSGSTHHQPSLPVPTQRGVARLSGPG